MKIHNQTTSPSLMFRLSMVTLAAFSVWLSAPGTDQELLALLSLLWPLPLALALQRASAGQGALIAGGLGFLFWLHSVWWLLPAIVAFTGVSLWLALPLYAALCLLCALPYAVFGALVCRCHWLSPSSRWRQLSSAAYISAALTVCLYWLPTLIPGQPLHALYRHPEWLQLLELGGVPLLSFAIGCLQWSLALALIHRRRRHWPMIPALAAAVIATLILGYGYLRLWQLEQIDGKSLRIAALQPNLSRSDNIDWLYQQSEKLLAADADIELLLWPEFPPAYSAIESERHRERTLALTADHQAALMVVSGYVYSDSRKHNYYNAAQLIQGEKILGQYQKQILVPFFEYLPFEALRSQFPDSLLYVPGNNSTPLQMKQGDDSIRIATAICYEVIFPTLIQPAVAQGAELLINPVSDSWFGDSNASAHHFSLALFRSIEHRLPMVRVANSGISAFVDAGGIIVEGSETELMTQAVTIERLTIPTQRSLYSRTGNSFIYLLSALLMICLGLKLQRSLKH